MKKESNNRQKPSGALTGRLLSTLLAVVLLAVVLRYLPPGSRNAQARTGNHSTVATPDDVRLGNVQMSWAPAGEALYLDGVITNTGEHNVTGATVQVDFHDEQGKVVNSMQKPIVGMAHGGVDLIRNEFARNPIQPNEMRFFRNRNRSGSIRLEPRSSRTNDHRGQRPLAVRTWLAAEPETAMFAACALPGASSRRSFRSWAWVALGNDCLVERFRQTTPVMINVIAMTLRTLAGSWNTITPSTATAAVPTADQMA